MLKAHGLALIAMLGIVAGVGPANAQQESPVWQPYRIATPPPIASPRAIAAAPLTSVQITPVQANPVRTNPVQGVQYNEPLPVFMPPPECAVELSDELSNVPCVALPTAGDSLAYASPAEPWHFQVLPDGVMWSSYMAGVREPRISGVVYGGNSGGALLDVTLGGRMAILRNGTTGPTAATGRPQGWELQVEGAALPRLNLSENWDLESVDFRFGAPLIYAKDNWQWKFSYYHLSAHLGDEFAIRENALASRINYSRETLVLGFSYFTAPAWRWYAEGGWAFHTDGGAEPFEVQFGVDIAQPGPTGVRGTPFAAFNGHLREEVDFGGNFVAQAGWLWRGATGSTVRTGFHYFDGKSSQYEFFNRYERQIGGGIWTDF